MKRLFKKVVTFFKKRPNLFVLIALALIVFLAYGLTLKMYWWVDDWGLLFKMIHPESAPGNLGAGLWGEGAYRFLATPFIFLYPTLGIGSTPYFALGLMQYLFLSFLVYLLVKKISGDFLTAFGSAAIFASGYMGSYALYRLSNSYQLIDTGILMVLTVYVLIHYFQTKRFRFYILSLILYTSTIEFLFLRAHGIVFVVAAAIFLFAEKRLNLKTTFKNLFRLTPFLLIYYYFYISAYSGGSKSNASLGFVSGLIKSVIQEKHFEMILNFFANFFVLVVPYDLSRMVYSTVFKIRYLTLDQFLGFLGLISFVFVCLFLIFLLFKRRTASKLIIFSAIWLIANYAIYYLYNPAVNLFSTTRYLIPSFIGSSILIAAVLHGLGILNGSGRGIKRFLGLAVIGLIVCSFIYLTREEEKAIIGYASIPTKQAYEAVRKTVSVVNEKTLFFFELEDNAPLRAHLLGGMGQLGISIFFNYNDETRIADTYDEVFYLLSSGKYSIDNFYGYYGDTKEGFSSFTEKFRKLVRVGGSEKGLFGWDFNTEKKQSGSADATETKLVQTKNGEMVGVNPSVELVTNSDSIVPSELTLTMRINSLPVSSLKFPFRDVTARFSNPESFSSLVDYEAMNENKANGKEVIQALREEYEKQEFLRTSKVTTSSSWKDREAIYIHDGSLDTNWNAHNSVWNTGKRPEEILIDLGRIKTVSKLIWINNQPGNTPIDYTISFSNDGKIWFKQMPGTNKTKRESLEMVTENFSPTQTRFLKMNIYNTFSESPPSIVEIWTSGVAGIFDFSDHERIINCPFCYISDIKTYQDVAAYQNRIATARLWWATNRKEKYFLPYSKVFPIVADGKTHVYRLIIPAQGTVLEKIKINSFTMPVKIVIEKATIRSLSLSEMKKMGLIHEIGGGDIRLNNN